VALFPARATRRGPDLSCWEQVIRRVEVERPEPKDVHLTDIPAMSLVGFGLSVSPPFAQRSCCACQIPPN